MSSSRATPKTTRVPKEQMLRFEAAVRTISEGLCMFDASQNLVICNDRYASIYDLPPELRNQERRTPASWNIGLSTECIR
jgi:PAS domain-containing protein